MTRAVATALPPVPPWLIVRADGSILRQSEEGEHPTKHLDAEGVILGYVADGQRVLLAPSPSARIHWLTTREQGLLGGSAVRRVGPGIKSAAPVRLWMSRGCLVLTDGPIEQAIRAVERFVEAKAWR